MKIENMKKWIMKMKKSKKSIFLIILIIITLYLLKSRNYLDDIQEEFQNFGYYSETKKSMDLVKNDIFKVDKIIELKFKNNEIIYPKFRVYTKHKYVKTPYAYTSLLFGDDTYLPGIITLGYSIRKTKTKNNLTCMVQDKPSGNYPGISNDTINELLEIYDVVYGIDLLEIPNYIPHSRNFTFKNRDHYSNISAYVSKSNVFGLLDYEKVFFMDSSTILLKNIDFVFNNDKDTYTYDKIVKRTGLGLRATFILIKPSLYNYNKTLFLIKNYYEIFKTHFFIRGVDEVIIFYTVYPNWNSEYLPSDFDCERIKTTDKSCSLIFYQINKPFKKNKNDETPEDYKYWDDVNQLMFYEYPKLKKYYSNIINYRTPLIKNLYD
jgi:hypothetical protein